MVKNIEEAIYHCQERAKADCSECAKEHFQLAEWLEELKEYRRLEEQGLLLKLPCKVEDTVYEVQKNRCRIQPLEIISVYIGVMGELYFNWELKDGIGIYQNIRGFEISQLGKTVFLTQAEAEEALKRMEGEWREKVRLIDTDELIAGRVENDPVVIAAKCAPTAYDVEHLQEGLRQLKNDGWILVEERRPENIDLNSDEEFHKAIVLISDGLATWIAVYDDGEFRNILDRKAFGNVIAWRPFPAPYQPKEAKDGKKTE